MPVPNTVGVVTDAVVLAIHKAEIAAAEAGLPELHDSLVEARYAATGSYNLPTRVQLAIYGW